MKEKFILRDIIDDLDAATASGVDVRTVGGDQDVDPPEIVIDWNAPRLSRYGGHNNRGGFTTDVDGNKDGYEFHQYYRMEADCIIRSEDEEEMTDLANTVQDTFAPYEHDASLFDVDTAEWEVGSQSPRENAVLEPDWYQIGVPLEFVFVRRSTATEDTLETINKDTDIDITLEDGEITIETT